MMMKACCSADGLGFSFLVIATKFSTTSVSTVEVDSFANMSLASQRALHVRRLLLSERDSQIPSDDTNCGSSSVAARAQPGRLSGGLRCDSSEWLSVCARCIPAHPANQQ
jgi:hypothetical protein